MNIIIVLLLVVIILLLCVIAFAFWMADLSTSNERINLSKEQTSTLNAIDKRMEQVERSLINIETYTFKINEKTK